jgi:hypothetical protein
MGAQSVLYILIAVLSAAYASLAIILNKGVDVVVYYSLYSIICVCLAKYRH